MTENDRLALQFEGEVPSSCLGGGTAWRGVGRGSG